MGYRSTVAYTIRFTPIPDPQAEDGAEYADAFDVKQCKESFYTFLAEAKVKCTGAINDEDTKVDESNMAINFFASDVKWYESYEDVQCHEALIQLSKDWVDMENRHIGGIFIRIGEEMDDITEEEWGEADWDWLCVTREVHCDWMS